jgi:hypothetical protein
MRDLGRSSELGSRLVAASASAIVAKTAGAAFAGLPFGAALGPAAVRPGQ